MRYFLIGLFLIRGALSWQQEALPDVPLYTRSGLVYYYFWEEDENGSLLDSSFCTPFSMNNMVLIDQQKNTGGLSAQMMLSLIRKQGRTVYHSNKERYFTMKKGAAKITFVKEKATAPSVVIYVKKQGKWTSSQTGRILYFDQFDDGCKHFAFAKADFISVRKNGENGNIQCATRYNTFQVIRHYRSTEDQAKGSSYYDHVIGYNGHELSAYVQHPQAITPKRILIFANGYRGPQFDRDDSRNEMYLNDRTNYWFNLDNRFTERLKPDTALYIDGSFSVKTSNHRSKLGFGLSYLKCTWLASPKHFLHRYSWLNTEPNISGFEYRKTCGYQAGLAYLNTVFNVPGKSKPDTLDIVCHSMGYAYTLGFIEAVKNQVVFDKLYILAPENASAGSIDWSLFREVWQYGSNLGENNPDILCYQDGVAPQTAVPGLNEASDNQGRLFSPANWPNKHFIHSHMVYSYDWIFDRIQPNEPGYIHPR